MLAAMTWLCLGQTYNKDISVNVTRSTSLAPPLSISANAKFSVAIFNGTKNQVKILSDQCGWGYESISFDIQNPAGKIYKVTRVPKKWFRDFPKGDSIDALGFQIRKIDFGDKTWQGMPSGVAGQLDGWKLRVNFKVDKSRQVKPEEYWTGSLQSGWIAATMEDHKN